MFQNRRTYRSYPGSPLYTPLSGDGIALNRVLDAWSKVDGPLYPKVAMLTGPFPQPWMLDLCLHKNAVRFDFREDITAYLGVAGKPSLEGAWKLATGYHTSETAKLAFTLQYLALDRERTRPRYTYNPARWVKPEPRAEQTDGPKRRRFRNKDRHGKAVLPRHLFPGCSCPWCRGCRKNDGPAPDSRFDTNDPVDNIFAEARRWDDVEGLPTSLDEVDTHDIPEYCECHECGREYCVCGWNCDEDDYDLGDPNERIIP